MPSRYISLSRLLASKGLNWGPRLARTQSILCKLSVQLVCMHQGANAPARSPKTGQCCPQPRFLPPPFLVLCHRPSRLIISVLRFPGVSAALLPIARVSALPRLPVVLCFAVGAYSYVSSWPHLRPLRSSPAVVAIAHCLGASSDYPACRHGMPAGVCKGDVFAHVLFFVSNWTW